MFHASLCLTLPDLVRRSGREAREPCAGARGNQQSLGTILGVKAMGLMDCHAAAESVLGKQIEGSIGLMVAQEEKSCAQDDHH